MSDAVPTGRKPTDYSKVATWWFVGGATLLTIITALAAIDMCLGNATAINAVIGAGIGSVLWWALAITMLRDGS